ncbi:MAG: HD domain-containing protein [Clostridia bacterium]|nr:HD domain-containing protein [Clostridia bacterium]
MVDLEKIKKHKEVDALIQKGDEYLSAQGFTEHGYRHLNLVSHIASNVLERLGYGERDMELASIAGYLHDIGNVVGRHEHGISGAAIVYNILTRMGMDPVEIAVIISSIGNHEEEYGEPVNHVGAALILADKSDVHRSRIRNAEFKDAVNLDIHDRVNYAVKHSFLRVDEGKKSIDLELQIDLKISSVIDYFEIFLKRMMMCRKAADFLDCDFNLVINENKLV